MTYQLYYWGAAAGRAEYIRLMLEDAQEDYEMVEDMEQLQAITSCEEKGWPCFAVPVLVKGKLKLAQTPAIQKYLAQQLGYAPKTAADKAKADQVNLTVHDFFTEAIAKTLDDESKMKEFVEKRLEKFMKFFEKVLSCNKKSDYFVGDSVTWPDFAFLYMMQLMEVYYPDKYDDMMSEYEKCAKLVTEMIARPNIQTYLESGKRKPMKIKMK